MMDRKEPLENENSEATENENGKTNTSDKDNEETKLLGKVALNETSKSLKSRYFTEWQSPISDWLKPIHEWQRPLMEYQQPIREWYVPFGSRLENGEDGAEEEIFQP